MLDRKEYMKEWNKQYRIKNMKKELERSKQYRIDNREKENKRGKQWREENPEYGKEYMKKYYQENKEKCIAQSFQYQKNNPEQTRISHNQNRKERYKTDLKFNLNYKISNVIRKSLKGNKNGWHWEDLVGYKLNDLIKRLKSTLPKNYCWKDFLDGKLEIDHIIPKNVFNFTKSKHPDFRRCWALSNLQLLPARENLKKRAYLSKPFQPALMI